MIDLFPLLEMYNTYSHDDIYFDIVKNIVDNYNTLELDSLLTFSESMHVSPSSINRFLKELYYENFSNFKAEHLKKEEYYFYDYNYIGNIETVETSSFSGYTSGLLSEISQIIKSIDEKRIHSLYQKITQSKNIIFVGTPLIDDIWWLQLELILLGKKTSAFINPNYQVEAVENLTHDTLVIGIDIMRQDDIFIQCILKDAKKRGARVACISHFSKASYTSYVDEYLFYKGSNSRTDNFVLSLILNYIGKMLREKIIEPSFSICK